MKPKPRTPLFGLAPGGVYRAASCYQSRGALLPHLFTLTRHCLAVCFLWHFPWAHTLQALPGALSDGARTFLCNDERYSDCLADSDFLGRRILHLSLAQVTRQRHLQPVTRMSVIEMARSDSLLMCQLILGTLSNTLRFISDK